MERGPPPPPFPFHNKKNNFSDFPLIDPQHHPNYSLLNYHQSSFSSSYLSNSPPFAPQQMAFVAAAHHPTSWRINDPSALTLVSFHPPTYHYPYYYSAQQHIDNASDNTSSSSSSSSLLPTLQLLPPPQNHQNIPLATDHHHHQPRIKPPHISHKKKLKFVFKKELKSSDVSPLGRIVIPKKDAEENLPPLISREGISLVVRDLYSDRQWNLKYKFWSNNKSRMYILENTGDFMKKNRLKKGDLIIFYLDEESYNYFFSIKRVEEIKWEKHSAEEEDVALEVIIENLRHSDEQEEEANNLLTMGIQAGGPYNKTYTASSSSSYHQPRINLGEEFGSVNYKNFFHSFDDACWNNYGGAQ